MILVITTTTNAQINLLQDYQNLVSQTIGTAQGITYREAGFSGLYPIPNTNGKEFWVCSDRGVNIDAANANPSACRPTYDKMYMFPSYAPKIHRIRVYNGVIDILQTITIKRPSGSTASGIINPTGLGSTAQEQASTDTVLDCSNFSSKIAPKDTFGIDSEGLVVDAEGNFWLCDEGGATIWKLNSNGVLIKRYTPYYNLPNAQSVDVALDTVFKYRKNNRGFEGISITPNGKIYAIIQSPILYPSKSVGEATRVHRIIEIDPVTNTQRMFAYLNDGIIGASGPNQIRLRDWKIGDMAAINDSTFLVLETAIRGTSDYRRLYEININQATPVHSGLYGGLTLEALVDSTGLANKNIKPVTKKLTMDLLANGWPVSLEKPEGLAILNDSTIAICNDNDYGQVSPLENGIGTATGITSHLIAYGLSGLNKLNNFIAPTPPTLSQGVTGVSSSSTPYLKPSRFDVSFTSILTVQDSANNGYKMCGIPDGLGAFDNGNGTFTLLMNHELQNTKGAVRAHGSIGAFVSKWVIDKNNLSVISGSDLVQQVKLWNGSTYTTASASSPDTNARFNRLCSADLPEPTAFFNPLTGLGTQDKIFMNGEESGLEGRAFAHIVTGSEAGISYQLPYLGRFAWENAVACPNTEDKTMVLGMDDGTDGQVYVYIGNKTNNGSVIDKAGLSNGKLYGLKVNGMPAEGATVSSTPTSFSLVDLGNVSSMTGAALNIKSNDSMVTKFLRPEDGSFDPNNVNDFYFATTNAITAPSRLWKLTFNDIKNPELGGNITAMLDGTEGQKMMDNLCIAKSGKAYLQEDIGNNSGIGKIWEYNLANDAMQQIAYHDSNRFIIGGANFLTQDEESSGIIDMSSILGAGKYVLVTQAHYPIAGEFVEGGQLLAMDVAPQGCYIPGAPANLTINTSSVLFNNITGISATMSWAAIEGIGWYEIRWKPSTSSIWSVASNGTSTAKLLTNLQSNTLYDVQIRAYCASNTPGPWCGVVNFTTNSSCTTPTNVSHTTIANGTQTQISWNSLPLPSGTYYAIRYRVAPTGSWINVTSTSSPKLLTGLLPNTLYDVQVAIVCGGAFSAYSNNYQFTTNSACASPTNLFANNITSTTAKLNWTPAYSSSPYYTVRWKPVTNSSWTTGTTNVSSKTIAGLTLATTYEYQVLTNCSNTSSSAWTSSAYFTTSSIIAAKASGDDFATTSSTEEVAVYPNPVQSELKVDIQLKEVTDATIKLIDMSGRLVQEATWQGNVGLNNVVMNVNHLIPGVYSLQIIQNSQLKQVVRIIKN